MPVLQEHSVRDATVLMAVDHRASMRLLTDRLERQGVQTERVQNGNDALDVIDAGEIDLMVAQTRLPGRTGLELLRQVPPLEPAVILLGREGNDEVIVRAFEFGAADYITRPFSPSVAMARILRFLKVPRPFLSKHSSN